MAHSKFPLEVLTPEGEAFSEEVEMVSTKTALGSIGILAHHSPVLAILEPTELRIHRSEGDVVRFAQGEGYLQVSDNRALMLVEEVISPEDLDRETLQTRLQEAQSAARSADQDSEQRASALRDVRRCEAFLRVDA